MNIKQRIARVKADPRFDEIESELFKAKSMLDYWLEQAQSIADTEGLVAYVSMEGNIMLVDETDLEKENS